jgi:hypothetical protein
VDETCAKCGKNLSWTDRRLNQNSSKWLEKHPEWLEKHPEQKNKKICYGCLTAPLREIIKKKRGYEMQNTGIRDIYEKQFRVAQEQGRQIVVIKDAVFSADGIGKHIENYSKASEKFGYAYKSETHFPDSVGISLSIIFEKIQETRNVQVFLDFSSLKDEMAKGGVVMTTYKCPNCNGMVDIPEAGKVLVCQYCGTPIKPVDIFEKIKQLIQ